MEQIKKAGKDLKNIEFLTKEKHKEAHYKSSISNTRIIKAIDESPDKEKHYPKHSEETGLNYCHRVLSLERERIKKELGLE